ncbi:membrane protein [Cellulomonas soli]|uniref:Membrane protein n=1 Tax=Cellulomonas soli TaxID=931535 RepID=A0A512PHE7_9CELL|nr:membrane protein [Cellulomonas soli]
MLNKVPEITAYFWIIKVLATTVGETFADFLTGTWGMTLNIAGLVVGALLVAVLAVQLRIRRYLAPVYWLAVVLISVMGTLVTDNLVDDHGVPLALTTTVFAVALTVTFVAWYRLERTLSIHSITSARREGFYWAAILFTFALGTAAGDLLAETLGLGYGLSVVVFAAAIGLVALAYRRLGLGAVVAFWAAYVLTRPLGASIGDLLSQSRADGGLGLGTTGTSILFLAAIAAVVVYLTVTRRDVEEAAADRLPALDVAAAQELEAGDDAAATVR